MVKVRDKDPWDDATERQITEKEHERALDRYLDVYARAEDVPAGPKHRAEDGPVPSSREDRDETEGGAARCHIPELMDNLHRWHRGAPAAVRRGAHCDHRDVRPGNEVAGPKTKTRYECKVPGDVHWDLTKFAYMNRNGLPVEAAPRA